MSYNYNGAEDTQTHMRRIVGDPKPSGFPEYDSLTGYVTNTYVSEWYDRQGNKWRSEVTVINLGKPDRGVPVDPDALIVQAARLEPGASKRPRKPLPRHAESAHRALQLRVVDHLHQHGWTNAVQLARAMEVKYHHMHHHLMRYVDTVYCWQYTGQRQKEWGLVGVHDAAE